MTDHNAEGGKKVEPCNLCGFTPVECNDSGIEVVPCKCFMPDDWTVYRERWNALQRRILAQRRKDFEAGQESMLSPGEFVDTSVATSFDEYLAKSRK